MSGVRIQKEWYERDKVAADACAVYLFGENYAQEKGGYVPRATQAVIRGLPNAIGIPTKNDPDTLGDSFLSDEQFTQFQKSTIKALEKAMRSDKVIVIPADGIGTGAARLSLVAPKCAAFLGGALNTLAIAARL